MSGFDREVLYAEGIDLTNQPGNISNQLGTDGFVYFGNSSGRPQAGLPDSADGSITFTGGAGTLDAVVDTSNLPTVATTFSADSGSAAPSSNVLNVNGSTVANATNASPLFSKGSGNTIDYEIQVAAAITGAPSDKNDAGLISANDTQFTVNSDGYMALVGGTDLPALQTLTSDDSTAAGPDNSGDITIEGAVGAETVTSTNKITVHSKGASQFGSINLGLVFSGGTATIQGADGNSLSQSNPGYVTVPSNVTNSTTITYKLTSDITFDDAGGSSSAFAGSLFGFDTGDTTSTLDASIPFFIHAAGNSTDSELKFFISRIPWPTMNASFLNDAASGNADGMADIISLEVLGGSLSNFNGSFASILGQFRMDINGSDDWAIDEFNNSVNGFYRFDNFDNQILEKGVYGAATNSYFLDNGGTAPTISTDSYHYKINLIDNTVNIDIRMTMSGSPSGAVDALMNIPLFGQNRKQIVGTGYFFDGGSSGNVSQVAFRQRTSSSAAARQVELFKANGTTAKYQYEEFASGDIILAQFSYRLN